MPADAYTAARNAHEWLEIVARMPGAVPAPAACRVLSVLAYAGGHTMGAALRRIGDGLGDSLFAFEVIDTTRGPGSDPVYPVIRARQSLEEAAQLAERIAALTGRAQAVLAFQGHNGPAYTEV